MNRVLGVYQTGRNSFVDGKGNVVEYDNIMISYETDEIPDSMDGHYVGTIVYRERFKRGSVVLKGLDTEDWFELVGCEVEFGYKKDKKEENVLNKVIVMSKPFDDKNKNMKEKEK